MNSMFSTTAIKGMYPLMVEELNELKKYLLAHDSTQTAININDILQKVALVSLFINLTPLVDTCHSSGYFDVSCVWCQLPRVTRCQ